MIRPLHFAVINRAFTCIQILIAAGANPLAEDGEGQSPFELAKEINAQDILSLFESILNYQNVISH